MTTPKINPINVKEYTVKQSKYEVAGTLPIRSVILGPSGSSKTVLLQNTILYILGLLFTDLYFSPSVKVESTSIPIKKYIEVIFHKYGKKNIY